MSSHVYLVVVPAMAVATAGCLEAPRPFSLHDTQQPDVHVIDTATPPDGTPLAGSVLVVEQPDHYVVNTQNLVVSFDADRGWAPGYVGVPNTESGQTATSTDILYTGTVQDASFPEEGLGVLLYRNGEGAMDSARGPDSETGPRQLFYGPALFQLTRAWSLAAAGGALEGGVTTYTVHPDGRLHIHHTFDIRSPLPSATYLVSVLALQREVVDGVQPNGDQVFLPVTPDGEVSSTGAQDFRPLHVSDHLTPDGRWICGRTEDSDRADMAVGFAGLPRQGVLGVRATESWVGGDTVHSVRLQFDWARGEGGLVGLQEAAFLVAAQPRRDCAARLATTVSQFLRPPPIDVSVGERDLDDPFDRNPADGYLEGSGLYALKPDGDAREVAFRFETGLDTSTFRITLPEGHTAENLTATVNGAPTPRLATQVSPDGGHVYVAFLTRIQALELVRISW